MKAGLPSRTAGVVAGGVVLASLEPSMFSWVDPEAARLTRRLLLADSWGRGLLRMIDRPIGRAMLRQLERRTIPGIIQHWNCRKRWIEAAWLAARRDGFDTLITLGSGYDTLSLRASAPPNSVLAVDVDHPATLKVRRAAVSSIVPESHRFIDHDLSCIGLGATLPEEVGAGRSLFIVIEGVLMYLDPVRVRTLFDELSRLPAARLRLAFTFMESYRESPPAFRPRSRLVDLWLRCRGEPFRSGLDPGGISEWLGLSRFSLLDLCDAPGRKDDPSSELRGEWSALAERSRPFDQPAPVPIAGFPAEVVP